MALTNLTPQGYYKQTQSFRQTDASNAEFKLTNSFFDPLPSAVGDIAVYVDNVLQSNTEAVTRYTYASNTVTFGASYKPALNTIVKIEANDKEAAYGTYQNIKLKDIVTNFMISYVGDGKLLKNVSRTDVLFHAQRGIQELSYDTLQSYKSQEIEVPPSLAMTLPHDYVNYVKLSWVNDDGHEYILFPIRKSSNPVAILQDSDFSYLFDDNGKLLQANKSETLKKYQDNTTDESNIKKSDWYTVDLDNMGGRYGLDPALAQDNGGFLIDQVQGKIHFTGNLTDKIVTLKYVSDGLNIDDDSLVHKFAEEAIYKYIAYAILSTKINIPEYIVNRYRRERRAAVRNAKLRLSNLKSEELTQIMRGKTKHIK